MQFQVRKWFAAGTAAVMLLSGMAFFPATGSAEGTMTAEDITENMTIGWNIGNSLDSTGYDETSWGNPKVTQELIDTVKAKGFNTIRIPTTWYQNVTTTTDENGKPVFSSTGKPSISVRYPIVVCPFDPVKCTIIAVFHVLIFMKSCGNFSIIDKSIFCVSNSSIPISGI